MYKRERCESLLFQIIVVSLESVVDHCCKSIWGKNTKLIRSDIKISRKLSHSIMQSYTELG